MTDLKHDWGPDDTSRVCLQCGVHVDDDLCGAYCPIAMNDFSIPFATDKAIAGALGGGLGLSPEKAYHAVQAALQMVVAIEKHGYKNTAAALQKLNHPEVTTLEVLKAYHIVMGDLKKQGLWGTAQAVARARKTHVK